jgi:hypothetical protein
MYILRNIVARSNNHCWLEMQRCHLCVPESCVNRNSVRKDK